MSVNTLWMSEYMSVNFSNTIENKKENHRNILEINQLFIIQNYLYHISSWFNFSFISNLHIFSVAVVIVFTRCVSPVCFPVVFPRSGLRPWQWGWFFGVANSFTFASANPQLFEATCLFSSWSMLFNTINSSGYVWTFLSFFMFWSSFFFHFHESLNPSRLAWGWLLAPCERWGGSIASKPHSTWTMANEFIMANRDWLARFLNYLDSWRFCHMAHGLVMNFSGPPEAFLLESPEPDSLASWEATMASSVQSVTAKHLQSIEDAMNFLFWTPSRHP